MNDREYIEVGRVFNYFKRLKVVAVELNGNGSISVGDEVCIKSSVRGIPRGFNGETQTVESMQVNKKVIQSAGPGARVGIKFSVPAPEPSEYPTEPDNSDIPHKGDKVFVFREKELPGF